MEEESNAYNVLWKSQKAIYHSEKRGVDGNMGSELILGSLAEVVWSGFNLLRVGTGGGLL
jgi:hypothetical protein